MSILVVILFILLPVPIMVFLSRLSVPLFLKLKKTFIPSYVNGYSDNEVDLFSWRIYIRRCLYLVLLILGIAKLLIDNIDVRPFFDKTGDATYEYYETLGIPVQYSSPSFMAIMMISSIIAITLWSISWTMEDAGLMHYKKKPGDSKEIVEVEPIHLKYSSFIKGIGGITSILFIIDMISAWKNVTSEDRTSDIVMVVINALLPFIFMLAFFWGYSKHVENVRKSLRSDLIEFNALTESLIIKEESSTSSE